MRCNCPGSMETHNHNPFQCDNTVDEEQLIKICLKCQAIGGYERPSNEDNSLDTED